jgi:hypothetical protein
MQHMGTLTAKPLAKHLGDIRFVVNDENAESHATLLSIRDGDCCVAPLPAMRSR